MKKNFYILLLLVLSAFIAKAQSYQWVNQIAGTNSVPFTISVNDIQTISTGDVFIAGQFSGTVDFDPGSNVENRVAVNTDAFVARYDAGGNFVWVYTTNAVGTENIKALNFKNQYSTRITFALNSGGGTSFNLRSVLVSDGSLASSSAVYTSTGSVEVNGMSKSEGGVPYNTFAIVGTFTGTLTIGSTVLTSNGGNDIFYASFFNTGTSNWSNFLYANSIGGTGNDTGLAIELRNDQSIVCGSFEGTVDFDASSNIESVTSAGGQDAFLLDVDYGTGFFRKINVISGISAQSITSISIPAQNTVYIGGTFFGSSDFDFSNNTTSLTGTSTDGFVAKYSVTSGLTPVYALVWANKFGGNNYDEVVDIVAPSTTSDVFFAANISNGSGTAPFIGSYLNTGTQNAGFGGLLVPTNLSTNTLCNAISSNASNDVFLGGFFQNTTIDFNTSSSTNNLTNIGSGFNGFLLKMGECNSATAPTISQVTNPNGSVTLTVSSGLLNGNNNWVWYSTTCGGTNAGTGNSITVSTNGSGTYFVRGEGGCAANGSCSAGENVNVVLPVTLISFTADKHTSGVLLNWKTASETNNDYFEISHSTDGKTFKSLAIVKPKSADLEYSFLDKSPINGVNYYQLLQFDKDGKRNDLGIKFVNYSIDPDLQVSVYPNPAVKDVRVIYPANVYQSIKIVNLSGATIISQNIKTGQYISDLSISDFKPGTYLVIISGTNSIEARKLIVK